MYTTASITAALAAALAARREWDEPPDLLAITIRPTAFDDGPPDVRLESMGVPEEAWAMDRPPAVLTTLAEMAAEFGPGVAGKLLRVPEGFCGTAFRFEAWSVASGPPGSQDFADTRQQARARQLHRHPRRVETRHMYAAGADGTAYRTAMRRGMDTAAHVNVNPPGDPAGHYGTILRALHRLTAALTAAGAHERT